MLFDGEVTGGEPCGPVEHVATRDGLEQWGLGGESKEVTQTVL